MIRFGNYTGKVILASQNLYNPRFLHFVNPDRLSVVGSKGLGDRLSSLRMMDVQGKEIILAGFNRENPTVIVYSNKRFCTPVQLDGAEDIFDLSVQHDSAYIGLRYDGCNFRLMKYHIERCGAKNIPQFVSPEEVVSANSAFDFVNTGGIGLMVQKVHRKEGDAYLITKVNIHHLGTLDTPYNLDGLGTTLKGKPIGYLRLNERIILASDVGELVCLKRFDSRIDAKKIIGVTFDCEADASLFSEGSGDTLEAIASRQISGGEYELFAVVETHGISTRKFLKKYQLTISS